MRSFTWPLAAALAFAVDLRAESVVPGQAPAPTPAPSESDAIDSETSEASEATADAVPAAPKGGYTDSVEHRVPLQLPVPPPPAVPSPIPPHGRRDRFLDLATDLAEAVARDGGMMLGRSFGGVADRLVLRGSSDSVAVTLDGHPYNVPLAGRGAAYADLRLLPVAAIESYQLDAFGPDFSGRLDVRTRELDGVSGGIYVGERGARRLSLAGGATADWGHTLLAFETREAARPFAAASDDRITMLGGAGVEVGRDLSIDLLLRFYRDVWDGSDIGDDGGGLRGTGAGMTLAWTPSEQMRLTARLSALDDRFGRFTTGADGLGRESRDRNRVGHGLVDLEIEPEELPATFGAALIFGYDDARTRLFAAEGRARSSLIDRYDADWSRNALIGRTTFEAAPGAFIDAQLGVDQITVRREVMRSSDASQTARDTEAVGSIALRLEGAGVGGKVALGRGSRTHPGAFTGALEGHDAVLLGHNVELGLWTRASFGGAKLHASLVAFGALYGADWINDAPRGEEALVAGAELRVDFTDPGTGLTLAARGGPLFSVAPGAGTTLAAALANGRQEDRRATGVPSHVAHAGLLYRHATGIAGELWLDSYGGWAEGPEPDAVQHDGVEEMSARLGWRAESWSFWLGVDNLLDRDDAEALAPRTLFAMLDVVP